MVLHDVPGFYSGVLLTVVSFPAVVMQSGMALLLSRAMVYFADFLWRSFRWRRPSERIGYASCSSTSPRMIKSFPLDIRQ